MELRESIENEDEECVVFNSYLRSDFLNCELKLYAQKGVVEMMAFYSNSFGICKWHFTDGITECNSWESEQKVQTQSYLSKHFTSLFMNASKPPSYALDKIVPDVLSQLKNEDLKQAVSTALRSNEPFRLDAFNLKAART